MKSRRLATIAFALPLLAGCGGVAQPAEIAPLSNQEFQDLSIELSEPPGYFDTDNLISNETSYQHVVPKLAELVQPGGAYIGVGPDQNFTYIATIEPEIAFILDIRRDNLLQHLFFKQLIQTSPNRWEYLSRLLGKPLPEAQIDEEAEVTALLAAFRAIPSDSNYFAETFQRLWAALSEDFPGLIAESERATLYRMARAFYLGGLDLKFSSHGRAPRPIYPTFGQLLAETDLQGRHRNYLTSERLYQSIRRMHLENRIVPVVGDMGGDKALRQIGDYLEKRGCFVSVFYTSNVEFYLFGGRVFDRFVDNVRQLPVNSRSLFIRSYFNYWRERHPETVPGYFVTSLLQPMERFLETADERPFRDYREIVWMDYIPIHAARPELVR